MARCRRRRAPRIRPGMHLRFWLRPGDRTLGPAVLHGARAVVLMGAAGAIEGPHYVIRAQALARGARLLIHRLISVCDYRPFAGGEPVSGWYPPAEWERFERLYLEERLAFTLAGEECA